MNRRQRHCCCFYATFWLLTYSHASYGDGLQSQANQRTMLPGGRAQMLGGAYTAISDDASGCYYNPAGLAFSRDNRIEASGTAYRTNTLTYDGAINDQPFKERSDVLYPSFLGGTAKLGPLMVGYAYMTLDARNVYQHETYQDIATQDGALSTYSRTFLENSAYRWGGATVSFKLTDHIAYGGSLFYYQRNIEFTTSQLAMFNGGGVLSQADTLKTINSGLASVQGLIIHTESFSLGLSVRSARALSDSSHYSSDAVSYSSANTTPTVSHVDIKYQGFNEMNPNTYSVGLAWWVRKWFLLSSDLLLHEGKKTSYPNLGGHDLHTTYNYSIGSELNLGFASLMAGYFTNNSLYRAPDPTKINQPTHIDYQGMSGGISWHLGGLKGDIGYVIQQGTGEAQILTDSHAIQKAHGTIATFLISGKVPL